jgi:hypothetical protein
MRLHVGLCLQPDGKALKCHRVFVRNAPRCWHCGLLLERSRLTVNSTLRRATWDQYARRPRHWVDATSRQLYITVIWTVNDDVYALALGFETLVVVQRQTFFSHCSP